MELNYQALEIASTDYTKALLTRLRTTTAPFTLQDIAGYSDLSAKAQKKFRGRLKNPDSLIVHVANQEGWSITLEGGNGLAIWTFRKE